MISNKAKSTFLLLVFVQGLHSIEEYQGKLWETFPPATFLYSLISDDLVTGFLVINIGLFVFGLLTYIFQVRKEAQLVLILIWFWIILELINGIGHPIWTFVQKGYTPGIITAPILLFLSIYLARLIKRAV